MDRKIIAREETLLPVWMKDGQGMEPAAVISADELTSLHALISYSALQSGSSAFMVERLIADYFGLVSIARMPVHAYDRAVRYLVEALPRQTSGRK